METTGIHRMARESISSAGIIAALALLAFAYIASPVLIPIALALYLNLLLSPVVKTAERLHIPPAISSALIVVSIVLAALGAINTLAEPAQEWFEKAPKVFSDVQRKMLPVTDPLEEISELAASVDDMTSLDASTDAQAVIVKPPNLFSQLTERLPDVALSVATVLFLTFFFLSASDSFLRKLTALGKNFQQKRRTVLIVRDIQHEVSYYLWTVTLINIGLGALVAAAMHFLDVPNPILWGTLATALNFIPFLGALAMVGVMFMVGLATFTSPAAIIAPASVYAALSIIEGNLVTPSLVGRNLALQPSVIFVMLIFCGWMWGVVGALLSVPITVALKVVSQRLPNYQYVSTLLQR